MDAPTSVYDPKTIEPIVAQLNIKMSEHLKIRPLQIDDFGHGHLALLAQLTSVGEVSEDAYQKQFERMRSSGCYYVTVIEDLNAAQVVAAATLFTECKFIHSAGVRARIEDVVVDSQYRGQRLANVLIETLKKLALHLNCYKLTLDCNDEMIAFYEKFGFKAELGRANLLTIRLQT